VSPTVMRVCASAPEHVVFYVPLDSGDAQPECSCGWAGSPINPPVSPTVQQSQFDRVQADARAHIVSAATVTRPEHALRLQCGCLVDLALEYLASTCNLHHTSPF
jgi:hypothetical protein